MKAILDNDTVQIEVTNICPKQCANCTRFVGLVERPFLMTFDTFKTAIDSMEGFPKMVGITGGEPLLHPDFERFCEYAASKFPKAQLGLWTCLPEGKEKYREVICKTFGNIFINDHTRADIFHHPFLVAAKDVIRSFDELFVASDKCHFQMAWSPSINPRGAYFCEMAASFSILFPEMSAGWDVSPGWWWKTPKDYTSQIEEFCPFCGGCLFLKRRSSIERGVYDVSPSNLDRLKNRALISKCVLSDLQQIPEQEQEPLAAYKDQGYRDFIALRYGIYLSTNSLCFNEPHLVNDFGFEKRDSLLERYRQRYI